MVDASSRGALMNKTPEEAWELIETVADANQHFNRRATSKGVYEVAPSDSTVLAKSLVDIVAMLKEIKKGQQVTPTLLKQQPDDSQQKPVKHCGIYSCNSHHTDECPQLQEDNTVASTHNFYDATTIPHYNRRGCLMLYSGSGVAWSRLGVWLDVYVWVLASLGLLSHAYTSATTLILWCLVAARFSAAARSLMRRFLTIDFMVKRVPSSILFPHIY
ncbi:hypothetical protein PIB30_093659 [Stylosanthes scabra]|uniref:Uncharacterized protein n=1 Tax=Stylosanthes scabra TaxID=79078 RepID=A0ABU6ZTX2_9FABA|nr:hypothetical protein [Stylosanthes scabra]